MYTHHKFDHEFERGTPMRRCYIVCSTPRSGSSLLCELLCNCGLGGAPTEFFDQEQMDMFMQVWGARTFEEYIAALLDRKTGPNGVFGFKLHHDQFSVDLQALNWEATFPDLRYVYITRRDRVRQAVSFSKALQTGQWATLHDHNGRGLVFDPDEIRGCIRNIELQEQRWEEFFSKRGISPMRILYEQLVPRQGEALREVLGFLDIEFPSDLSAPPLTLRPQADRHSERWIRRFAHIERTGSEPVWRRALSSLGLSRRGRAE